MSFILEALRKSESDRQRLGSVALADLPVSRRRRGQPWWVFAVGALLLVNLVVLVVVLLRDGAAPTPVGPNPSTIAVPNNVKRENLQTAPPAQLTAPTPSTATSNPLQDATAQIQYEPISTSELEIANAAASMPDGQTLVRPTGSFNPDAVQAEANAPAAAIPETRGSPGLHVDLHVYSSNARERFVLINMRRYTEGQQLPNGATVEQITPQGVVVYQNGSRYQLDRQ